MASEALSYGLKFFLGEHTPRPPYNAVLGRPYTQNKKNARCARRMAAPIPMCAPPPFFNLWIGPCIWAKFANTPSSAMYDLPI